MKTCSRCGEAKPLSEFYKRAYSKDGKQSRCKPCVRALTAAYRTANPGRDRENRLRYSYRMSVADFQAMLSAQGGGCAVCGSVAPGGHGTFHVDHDHACCPGIRSCGKCIRGLLCHGCNCALGYAGDSPETLRRAAAYLESRGVSAGA